MRLYWGIVVSVLSLFVLGCGDGDGGADLWAGKWSGEVDCQGYSSREGSVQGRFNLEGEFDDDGHLLMPAGNKKVPQKAQGQVDQWVPEGGGIAERTLVRFDDEEEHRVYVLQETHQKSDAGGSMASDTNEKFDMEVDGDSMKVSYEYQYKALGHGSFITDLEEQASCTGTLERK